MARARAGRPAFAGLLIGASLFLAPGPARGQVQGDPNSPDPATRGAYLINAAGCIGCHTDAKNGGAQLAGGRSFATPFGTFYSPNITPDPVAGIGNWSAADFVRALHEGLGRDGQYLYPVFPFTSFTGMSRIDGEAIYAYIMTLPSSTQPTKPQEASFPFGFRFLLGPWRWLNFSPAYFTVDVGKPPDWNRGAYLVESLSHCGECHTPRDAIGATDGARALSGTPKGPDGAKVPNITPDRDTGIGTWSRTDIVTALKTGMLPDGDFVGGAMGEVIKGTTGRLVDGDLDAIATYLMSLAPIANPAAKSVRAE